MDKQGNLRSQHFFWYAQSLAKSHDPCTSKPKYSSKILLHQI